MGDPKTPEAIAKWAEQQGKPAETPSYKRLTDADRITILKLHDEGLTLTAIAQRLSRSVSTIHDVVQAYSPTIDLAKRKLAASAERMAENIIENGLPRDHVQALSGIGVLKGNETAGLNVMIGLSLPGLSVKSEGQQNQAVIDAESDNQSYVNETK